VERLKVSCWLSYLQTQGFLPPITSVLLYFPPSISFVREGLGNVQAITNNIILQRPVALFTLCWLFFYSLMCNSMFYKIYYKLFTLKIYHYIFRPLWSSWSVKIIGQRNCYLILLFMLWIYKFPLCALCICVVALCSVLCVVLRVLFSNTFEHIQTHMRIEETSMSCYAV
jgi:hypothetical protein